MSNQNDTVKSPSIVDALIPIVCLVVMLATSVTLYGDNSSYGPNQIALLLAATIAALVGLKNGYRWDQLEQGIVKGISIAMGAILILLAVGALIGTWLLAGTVPALIYYGLQIMHPDWFYAATCLICVIVAISIGSSWTVAATVGVAFIGVANGFGLSLPVTAGAIISGAYFGDKMSPLSETTNLAPAVAGSELFEHIRHMTWTSIPSIVLALIIFSFMGMGAGADVASERIASISDGLNEQFSISILNIVPLLVLLALAISRVPALPAVFCGALVGGVWAAIFQQDLIQATFATDELRGGMATLNAVWTVMFDGISVNTGNSDVDELVSGGGMSSMLNTIWLIISAMTFGAVMESTGLLQRIVKALLRSVKSTGSLIASTLATCFGTNIITADQYIAIVMPGRMYKDAYAEKGLAPVNLSRTLEDAGTITSPLIPWNSCGAYMQSVLLVNPLEYFMYCFFNWTSPLVALLYGYIGFKIKPLKDAKVVAARGHNA
ncbi:Na+/H+ antiporter NhaC [Corallincola luteus]|uniref:Na+/H+ antiporter NhaC n=1 Tax=Corallincola luteus TaxID=1775177 RepID=A0ABY2ALS4_9GAMM|nr:Na+/H+ antiporter NhaC [Corallincola luteus]TCI03155.1 Na+/H+ antiporter NhaC [Corallincola luteus]